MRSSPGSGPTRRPERSFERAGVHAQLPAVGSGGSSDGALTLPHLNSISMAPFSAPFGGLCPRLRSLCDGRGLWERLRGPPQRASCTLSGLRCRSHDCRSAPSSTCAVRAGPDKGPRTPHGPSRHPVCRTGTPGAPFGDEAAGPVRHPRRFPRVAGGRPFSADPDRGALRPFPTARADPASPQRLAVYPRRDGWIVGTDPGGGENRGGNPPPLRPGPPPSRASRACASAPSDSP